MKEITYGHIDKMLRSLGFSYRHVDTVRAYEHEPTGALITLAYFPDSAEAYPGHLDVVRIVLKNYGLADSMEFTEKLLQAS